MGIFKKQKKVQHKTLQELQTAFNQIMFEIGDLHYRKHMIQQELSKITEAINQRQHSADLMGKDAAILRSKMQEEVKAKVEEGSKGEANEEITQN